MNSVSLSLTRDEAVVLADWLSKNSSKKEFFADSVEQTVFWNLECLLEKILDIPDTFPEAAIAAKARISSAEER